MTANPRIIPYRLTGVPTTGGPAARYAAACAAGRLTEEPGQAQVVVALDELYDRLAQGGHGWLARFWGDHAPRRVGAERETARGGIYIHGPVGRGKSLLMDLFADPPPLARTRRVHFHKFMLEIHARLHRLRGVTVADPLLRLARDIAAEVRVLCFDEFHVANIADAMILSRLFTALLDAGVVVVATSNFAPEELYKDGLQRARFLPFIDLLRTRLRVVAIGLGEDYRRGRVAGLTTWFVPADAASRATLGRLFLEFSDGQHPLPEDLEVDGRVLHIARAARGVAWLSFAELCERPLGTADYLALAQGFHTLLLEGVPIFAAEQRDSAQRFINLVDVLYEQKTKLIASAEGPADALYASNGPLAGIFQRTQSRLAEMASRSYLLLPHMG